MSHDLGLALSTSSSSLSLALICSGELLAEQTIHQGYRHLEEAVPRLEALLRSVHYSLQELTWLAVDCGPGSYTGIRIGLSTMKTLAYALQIPLFSYTSLAIVAYPYVHLEGDVLACLKAGRGRLYAALYRNGQALFPAKNMTADELLRIIRECETPTTYYVVGNAGADLVEAARATDSDCVEEAAARIHLSTAAQTDVPAACLICLPDLTQDISGLRATYLGHLGHWAYQQGERPLWSEVTANYCSLSQAERLRQEQAHL